jgi:hypothetical protein
MNKPADFLTIKPERASCNCCSGSEWFQGEKGLRGKCRTAVPSKDRFFVPYFPNVREGDFCPLVKKTLQPIAITKERQYVAESLEDPSGMPQLL